MKRFTSPTNQYKPIEFELAGETEPADGQEPGEWVEKFTAVARAPFGAMNDIQASVGTDGQGNMVYNRMNLINFFRQVLVDSDVARFDQLCRDKHKLVAVETLGEVFMWLNEEYAERPSGRPSS